MYQAVTFNEWDINKPISSGTPKAQLKINDDWKGLCGPISMAAILQITYPSISANDVMKQVNEAIGKANYISAWHMQYVINNYYGEYWRAKDGFINHFVPDEHGAEWYTGKGRQNAARYISDWLTTNQYVIAGVCINGSTGKLKSACGVSHWVVITGVSVPWDETAWNSSWNWVRIFNPFDNETEYHPWEKFKMSWEEDGNMMTLVSKKSQPPFPPPPHHCR